MSLIHYRQTRQSCHDVDLSHESWNYSLIYYLDFSTKILPCQDIFINFLCRRVCIRKTGDANVTGFALVNDPCPTELGAVNSVVADSRDLNNVSYTESSDDVAVIVLVRSRSDAVRLDNVHRFFHIYKRHAVIQLVTCAEKSIFAYDRIGVFKYNV